MSLLDKFDPLKVDPPALSSNLESLANLIFISYDEDHIQTCEENLFMETLAGKIFFSVTAIVYLSLKLTFYPFFIWLSTRCLAV